MSATAPPPPQNLDAEEAVLAAMMLSPAAIESVREILGDGAGFFRASHRTIYRAALALHDRNEPVDALTLRAELERRGDLSQIAEKGRCGEDRINELAALVPASANAGHHARLVLEQALRREQHALGLELSRAAEDGGLDAVPNLRDRLRALLAESTPRASQPRFVTLEQFVDVEETGAEALVGEGDNILIPEGGDVMFYGDGGAGKTTLAVDLAYHLAGGDPWLGIPVARQAVVLLIENEGPRPLFRRKLRRKRECWAGSPIEGRIHVMEEPWATLSLDDDSNGQEVLAKAIRQVEADVVVLGPVTRSGMNEAGTLQEVRDFMDRFKDVRARAARAVTFVLVHHENKGGKVSGAWEGAGDTLFHVQPQGTGWTRLYVQKARWSSADHGTTLKLAWAEGDGFRVAADTEHDDNTIADALLEAVLANGGASWNAIKNAEGLTGKGVRLQAIRDHLLEGGRLVNRGGKSGMKLWHADDPALPPAEQDPIPDWESAGESPDADPGGASGEADRFPDSPHRGESVARNHPLPPSEDTPT